MIIRDMNHLLQAPHPYTSRDVTEHGEDHLPDISRHQKEKKPEK